MSGSRLSDGRLPRPLAFLAALALAGVTAVSVTLLPARALPDLVPPSMSPALARPRPPGATSSAATGPASFVRFAEPGRDQGFDLADDARRTGARWYALAHLVAGPAPCTPAWTTASTPSSKTPTADDAPSPSPTLLAAPEATEDGDAPAEKPTTTAADEPGESAGDEERERALATQIRALRDEGGGAGLVLGGPRGRDLAAACPTPEGLAAAYGAALSRLGAAYLDVEARDAADRPAVVRRARALRLLQQQRRLPVTFTLPLHDDGLAERDVTMLHLTRLYGADIATVNLLATVEPSGSSPGRMRRVASAVRAAVRQVARVQGLDGPADAWHQVALTPVLDDAADLNETDARALATFAARNDLAWLSLRGAEPEPAVARVLAHTLA
ncbi:hypothetical protein [Nonomuraea roseoviolacea]|uniref:Chitinase n=1 Tax=Nonomuraea roseoviolacea subsp. carminata TaxID=160689 RepID=A0ABT1KAB3_9ACTN|nr:hypothetical protein [Nonomuraea roseoviolacea]MCP2349879.1 hypothetical protein [Nonomuraea roseoviolacea subsp. carminata]